MERQAAHGQVVERRVVAPHCGRHLLAQLARHGLEPTAPLAARRFAFGNKARRAQVRIDGADESRRHIARQEGLRRDLDGLVDPHLGSHHGHGAVVARGAHEQLADRQRLASSNAPPLCIEFAVANFAHLNRCSAHLFCARRDAKRAAPFESIQRRLEARTLVVVEHLREALQRQQTAVLGVERLKRRFEVAAPLRAHSLRLLRQRRCALVEIARAVCVAAVHQRHARIEHRLLAIAHVAAVVDDAREHCDRDRSARCADAREHRVLAPQHAVLRASEDRRQLGRDAIAGEERAKVRLQRLHRRIAIVGRLLQAPMNNRSERDRHVGIAPPNVDSIVRENARRDLGGRRSRERRLQRKQFIEHGAKRIDVRARIDRATATRLLRRHVRRRADLLAASRQLRAAFVAREAEVHHHGPAVGMDHHVAGLHVAMHDAGAMRGRERRCHVRAQPRARAHVAIALP